MRLKGSADTSRGYSQVTGLALNLTVSGGAGVIAQSTYTWDHYGNLASREDMLAGTTETEHYDSLNRLIKSVLSGASSGTITFTYDPAGDLTSRSDRGSYTYGGNGAGPHAVTSISDGSTFAYNGDGEMTSDDGESLAWSAFGKALSIQSSGTTVTFAYDAGGDRYEKDVSASSGTETVLYLGASEKLTVNGQASIRRTLTLADFSIIDTGGANAGVLFPIGDHLGSTLVLGDGSGQSTQSMNYGPFGRRMSAGWAGYMSVSQALTINETESDRGYTGEEELDAVSLVDLNARLYDPALGRFLSVDPLIAHPESTQGINPYSYVENDPLNRTDPTGEADLSNLGECSGGAYAATCVPTGTHIGSPTTLNPKTGAVSGALAGPGGNTLTLTTDGRGTATFTPGGSALQGQGTTGANGTGKTDVSDPTSLDQQKPDAAGGGTVQGAANNDAARVQYLMSHFDPESPIRLNSSYTISHGRNGDETFTANVNVSGSKPAFVVLEAGVAYWNTSLDAGGKAITLRISLTNVAAGHGDINVRLVNGSAIQGESGNMDGSVMTIARWQTVPGGTQSMEYETAAHEFGHALGFPDLYIWNKNRTTSEVSGFPDDIMHAHFGNRVQIWDAETLLQEY